MIHTSKIPLAVATALGALLLASTALAGPQFTFGPDNQGTLELEYKGQFQALARDIGSGANNEQNTYSYNFRRNRIALMGSYGSIMSLYVQTEFSDNPTVNILSVAGTEPGYSFQVLDAVARFDFTNEFKVDAGKFKYNLSRENLEACENPLTLDRSLFVRVPFVTTRDNGIAVWGNLLKDKFQYRADMMEGRKALDNTASPKSDFRFSARGHVSLLDPENQYGYKGTYLGTKKVLTLGAAVQYEPNLIYDDIVAQTAAKSYTGWTADYFFEYPMKGIGTSTIAGAYEKVDLDDAYMSQHPDLGAVGLDGQKNGWYVKAAHLLPKLPLQVFGRYEAWRFALLDNIYNQRIDWVGGGANYYIWGQKLKITAELSNTRFDKTGTFSGVQGTDLTTRDFNTFTGQLQVLF